MIRTASTEPGTSRTDFYLYNDTIDAFLKIVGNLLVKLRKFYLNGTGI